MANSGFNESALPEVKWWNAGDEITYDFG